MVSFNGRMDVLETELKSFAKKGYRIHLVASTSERLENLKEFAERIGLYEKIIFQKGTLSAGLDLPKEKICYISDNDIFTGQKVGKRHKKKKKSKEVKEDD